MKTIFEFKKQNSIISGLFRMTSANIINKVVAFIGNILVVRILSKYDYGVYSSAYNVISIVILFTGLGTISGTLQYGSEDRDTKEKNKFFKYSVITGLIFDSFLTLLVLLYAFGGLAPIQETSKYIIILAPSIIFHYIFEYLGALLRSKKNVKYYANLLNINSLFFSVLSCVGAFWGGIVGLSLSRSISYLIGIIVGVYYNRDELKKIFTAEELKTEQKKELITFSISCCITSALNRLLYVIDIAVITYIVCDPGLVAVYKVGTTIPEALEFIPQSIMVTVIPYFAEHNKDIYWLKKNTRKLYLNSFFINVFITIFLIVFSDYIISLFGNKEYQESIPIFIALSINYFIMATFRQIGTNILTAIRRIKYNVFISLITCVCNIILDVLFVSWKGIVGAAYATVISALIASLMSFPYLMYHIYVKNKKGIT